jgi:hypothetical protein
MEAYKGLTKKQLNVLSCIAFGGEGSMHHPATLKVLEDKGLIESYECKIYGKGNSMIDRIPMTVKRYEMPIAEHIEFCRWCSENCEQ